MFRWHLYDAWLNTAERRGFGLRTEDGSCIHMDMGQPKLEEQFSWMLWTPMNSVSKMGLTDPKDWRYHLDTWRDNEHNFHIEASLSWTDLDCDIHYDFFPEINHKKWDDITEQDINDCIDRILDPQQWEQQKTWAVLYQQQQQGDK